MVVSGRRSSRSIQTSRVAQHGDVVGIRFLKCSWRKIRHCSLIMFWRALLVALRSALLLGVGLAALDTSLIAWHVFCSIRNIICGKQYHVLLLVFVCVSGRIIDTLIEFSAATTKQKCFYWACVVAMRIH